MRKTLPLSAQIYVWSVVAAAVLLFVGWTGAWHAPVLQSATGLAPVALMFVLGVAATQFPLEVTAKYNLDLFTAVQFAALLLFGPIPAMLIAGGCWLVGPLILKARAALTGSRTRRTWRTILFNIAQQILSTGIGGIAYFSFLPHQLPSPQSRLENLWAVPFAATVMFLTNTWLVAGIAALQTGRSPWEVWRMTRRREVLHDAGLFLLGLITARTTQNDPWVPLVMALPTWIIYLATKRNAQLTTQTIEAVEALADIVDRRDRYTFEHSRRVAEYAQRIARAMKLRGEDVEQIRLAARVHDLGKIGVPNHVLHKDGALSDEEWSVMRAHPEMGHEILAKFPEYKQGRELVRSHHERYDGLGYPQGLASEHLLIGAQIIAVADTLDAMTSDRPYRRGLSATVALAALRDGKGSQYHPGVVQALERLMAGDPEGFLLVRRRTDSAPDVVTEATTAPAPFLVSPTHAMEAERTPMRLSA